MNDHSSMSPIRVVMMFLLLAAMFGSLVAQAAEPVLSGT